MLPKMEVPSPESLNHQGITEGNIIFKVVLRNISHTIQLTHLRYTIQWYVCNHRHS